MSLSDRYPPDNLSDPSFVKLFEPSYPPKLKGVPAIAGAYLTAPHIVFHMGDMLPCIVFNELLRGNGQKAE